MLRNHYGGYFMEFDESSTRESTSPNPHLRCGGLASTLLVDADERSRMLLANMLRAHGGRVLHADSPNRARDLLKNESIGLVFTEIKFPIGSQLAFLSECRQRWPQVGLVVVTSKTFTEETIEIFRLGAADIVFKPITRSAIEAALARVASITHSPRAASTESAPATTGGDSITLNLTGTFKQMERRLIEEVVLRFDGNKTAAAQALGLHRKTLYRMLSK